MLVFIDTETNGRNVVNHRIIQISAIAINGDQIIHYDNFVRQDELDPQIHYLTGITQNDIEKYGIDEHDAAIHMKSLMSNRPTIVAHNVQFDLSMLFDLLQRQLGSLTAYDLVSHCQWLDTLTIARDRWAYVYDYKGHKLADCIKHYNLANVENSHNALDDCKALYAVFCAMVNERNDINKYVNLIGYHPDHPISNNYRFDFLTYKPQSNDRGFVDANEILPLI